MRGLAGAAAFRTAVVLAGLAFLALFLLYPLSFVLRAAVTDDATGRLTPAHFAQVLSSRYYLGSLSNSLLAAGLATALTTAIGVPLGFCLARVQLPGKALLLTLSALPLVLPSFVAAYALVLLFGHAGVVTAGLRALGVPTGSIYGLPGIVLTFALTLYPYVLMPTVAGFRAIDLSMEEAARGLGGSRWHAFRTVLLPVVLPAVLAGGLLVFVEALENFGVPAVLAEDRPYLALDIFKLFAGESDSDPASAGALSLVLVGCTAAALLLQRRYLGRRRFATGARRAPPPVPLGPGWHRAAAAFSWGVVLLSLVPFAAVLVISFLQFSGPVLSWRPGLGNYDALLRRSYRPLGVTLLLASVATLVTIVLGTPIGYVLVRQRGRLSGLLELVATIPFAVSGTVLAIGLVIAFNSGPLVLTGGGLILVIAYVVRKLPFAVRSASAMVHQLDPSLEEASTSLGISPARTFLGLTTRLMAGGLVGAAVLIWVTVASELSTTIVLYSSSWRTMTVLMYQALDGTAAGEAAAAASVLILVTAIPLLLVHRLVRRGEDAML